VVLDVQYQLQASKAAYIFVISSHLSHLNWSISPWLRSVRSRRLKSSQFRRLRKANINWFPQQVRTSLGWLQNECQLIIFTHLPTVKMWCRVWYFFSPRNLWTKLHQICAECTEVLQFNILKLELWYFNPFQKASVLMKAGSPILQRPSGIQKRFRSIMYKEIPTFW